MPSIETLNNQTRTSYGMLIKDRSVSGGDYSYGWQGRFESDDEVSGKSDFVEWGGYGYSSLIGRRWSPDKLHAKYPGFSPYSAIGNNPIINQEIDGRDYSVYVDHETKTIIVKATYYVDINKTDDINSAKSATEFWNEQSDKFQYVISSGDETHYYNIQFELDVCVFRCKIHFSSARVR